jgi:hypothetical protein
MRLMGRIIVWAAGIHGSDDSGAAEEAGRDRGSQELSHQAGPRAEFIRLFETRAVPALRAHGMKILGPLLDLENPNKFVWPRSFPSLEERERMRDAFSGSDVWKNELEAVAMPLLGSYDVILCETSPGYVFDGPRGES